MKRNILSILAFVLLPLSVTAQLPSDSSVRIGKLDNGLTYYLRHNAKEKGLADFYIAQRVGSILEEPRQRWSCPLLGAHGIQWHQALLRQGRPVGYCALVRIHRREVRCKPECLYLS